MSHRSHSASQSFCHQEPLQTPPLGVEQFDTRQPLSRLGVPGPTMSAPSLGLRSLAHSLSLVGASLGSGLEMKLSDAGAYMQALVPLLAMPVWLPFSFIFSLFSYVVALLLHALDSSDSTGSSSLLLAWAAGPYGRAGADTGPDTLKLGRGRSLSVSSLTSLGALRGSSMALSPLGPSSSASILRALEQVLELVTALPSTSPKYSFARTLAEQLLQGNCTLKPSLVDLNRSALAKAFRRTMAELEQCLRRAASGGHWVSALRHWSRATGLTAGTLLGSAPALSSAASMPVSLRSEKLSQELGWLGDKLFEYGGGAEAVRLWAQASTLAVTAAHASPRVQGHLVRLSSALFRSVAAVDWTVSAVMPSDCLQMLSSSGNNFRSSSSCSSSSSARMQLPMPVQPVSRGESGPGSSCSNGSGSSPPAPLALASRNSQFRLLLLWLPLLCRATHAEDGPILSSPEKQRTEEAVQCLILDLSHAEQEVLFASWLHEYAWSTSDWPNLQPQYLAWCERARRVSNLSDACDVLY